MWQSEQALADVSRETWRKLSIYVEMLEKWNRAINLVSKTTLEDVWRRHVLDSLQIASLVKFPCQWIDLGSGGGLPGLIVAAKASEISSATHVTLVESDQRKCAFMSAAADAMDLTVSIQCRRIEESPDQTYDVVSARALASLTELLELALPYRHKKTICIFPKGAKARVEMQAAQAIWDVQYDEIDSQTDPTGKIFRLQEYVRVPNT